MSFFKKKEKEEEIPLLKEKAEMLKALKKYKEEEREKAKTGVYEQQGEFSFESKEYKDFAAEIIEERKPHSIYEKLCKRFGTIIRVRMGKKDAEKLRESLEFIDYHVEPDEIMGFSILGFVLFLVMSGAMLLVYFPAAMAMMLAGLVTMVLVQKWPSFLMKSRTIETMNYMPLAITYMVIYLRSTPTLEGAVGFAARHLSGPLARDMRGLLWKLQSGVYLSMDDALKEYAGKWKDRNKYFADSIGLLRESEKLADSTERLKMLDKASNVILGGNYEMMQTFARGMKMPILALYMLCIVLPVMGLVIAPVITTLMAQSISINALIIIYDVFLPIIVYTFTKVILTRRPGGFSQPDITAVPGIPKPGHISVMIGGKERNIPLLPVSLVLFFLVSIPGWMLLFFPSGVKEFSMRAIMQSMTFVWGASIAIMVYCIGSSYQKLKIRKELQEVESGLDVALYQLGNTLAMGVPVETAIETSARALKTGAIKNLFGIASNNMEKYNMSLRQALFDSQIGALRYYPSKLVNTIMEVLIESARVGIKSTSTSMITISKYLKNLNKIKNSIDELIGSTVSAMKFQAQFLTSFITGIIVALDVLLFKILSELSGRLEAMTMPGEVGSAGVSSVFTNSMFNIAGVVPAEHMQIVVGVYMLQVTVLLSLLINGTQNGKDDIYQNYSIGMNVLIASIIYTLAMVIGVLIFTSFEVA